MNTISLQISDIQISQDDLGRYCLNDLHKASGNENKHRPSLWLKNQQAIELIQELSSNSCLAPIKTLKGGSNPGTFVVKELVYAYAMWISPKFHLAVIRAYDALVTDKTPSELSPANLTRLQLLEMAMQSEQERLLLEAKVTEIQPKADALDRIATGSDGSFNITNTAKTLQMRPKDLFAWLSANHWIYRRAGGKGWVAYQDRIQSGLLEHKITTVERSDGSEKVVEQVLVTPKGLAKLSSAVTQTAKPQLRNGLVLLQGAQA